MGKTIVDAKLWNFLDEDKIRSGEISPIEVCAQIDNGATGVVLPEKLADELKLKKDGTTRVKYADERIEEKEVVIGLRVEIMGRKTSCDAIVEPKRTRPLIGQIVLEALDLWIDSKNGKLIPNPESPDAPLLEILRFKQMKTKLCSRKINNIWHYLF